MANRASNQRPVHAPPRTASVQAAAQKVRAQDKGDSLTPEEQAALGEPVTPVVEGDEQEDAEGVETGDNDTIPEWAVVPSGLIIPRGKQIYFIRIPAEWTDRQAEGDRQCIAWNLTVADEDIALKRTRGEQTRVVRECTMMMVRAIDGHKVDWVNITGPGNVRKWFDAIGPRGRLLVQNVYARTHSIDDAMASRFFVDCFASMSSK
jgi:hypothetical protein